MKKIKQIINIAIASLILSSYVQAEDPKTIASAPSKDTTQNLTQANNALVQANKDFNNAQTPEEKKKARKLILSKAQEILKITTVHRNLQGELIGYKDEEKEAAQDVLEEKTTQRDLLKKIVDDLKKQRSTFENKGWIWNSVKTGKEKEHAKITKKINKLEPTLNELNADVREQEIIAGKQKFTKTRAFAIASMAAVTTAAGFYLYYGPATSKAALLAFKDNPKKYIYDTVSSFKSLVSGWFGGSSNSTANTKLINGINDLTPTLENPSLIAQFGNGLIDSVKGTTSTIKNMAMDMTLHAGVSTALALAYQELKAMINDPDTTKEQLESQNEKIRTMIKGQQTQPKK